MLPSISNLILTMRYLSGKESGRRFLGTNGGSLWLWCCLAQPGALGPWFPPPSASSGRPGNRLGMQPWALSLPDKELCLREALAVCTPPAPEPSAKRKRVLTRPWPCWNYDFRLPNLQNEKQMSALSIMPAVLFCYSILSWDTWDGHFVHQDSVLKDRLLLLFTHLVMSYSLWPHGLQHTRLPCLSLSPGVCSNSCTLSQWCHPTISSSVAPSSSCPQSFPASGWWMHLPCLRIYS